MAKINTIIGTRKFEQIRDQIGAILADELSNQFVLSSDSDLDADVFIDRTIPINASECPLVNVMLARGSFDSHQELQKDGNYTYHIDVYSRGKSSNTTNGDEVSALSLQKLMGVIDAILSDHQYHALDFAKPSISNRHVESFSISDPTRDNDANHMMMGRVVLNVRVVETTDPLVGLILDRNDTTVKLHNTEKGYLFITDADGYS